MNRAGRMARRVSETARALGVGSSGRRSIEVALALAMEPRLTLLDDDHHPSYLHPGRCAVILMDDLKESDPAVIAAAVLVETEEPAFRIPADRIRAQLGPEVEALVTAVPLPDAGDLAERLLGVDERTLRIALTERLDQLRHAHLWEDRERGRQAHEVARRVYLPLAERSDPTLARRYRWWCSMFAKRHLA
jgi:(p)ppGpp synthase/HD superfamily hydrolase